MDQRIVASPEKARAARKYGVVRYILGISLLLAFCHHVHLGLRLGLRSPILQPREDQQVMIVVVGKLLGSECCGNPNVRLVK